MHVVGAAAAGAHIATVPFSVIKAMLNHPLTESGIERFMKDWAAAFNNK
jgi:transaldolase